MFDPGRLFGRGWIPHGSPLWPSLATADPAKVTKYHFLVSCASANERSIQIKGDASVQGGVAGRAGAEVAVFECFGVVFAKSPAPAARCAVKQIGFGSPAVLYCSPRGRCAARGRPGFRTFGFEVALVFS